MAARKPKFFGDPAKHHLLTFQSTVGVFVSDTKQRRVRIGEAFAAVQRIAPYVAVWLVLVGLFALTPLAAVWHAADYAVLENGLGLGRGILPDRSLAIVDLDTSDAGQLRPREIGVLDAVAAAAGFSAQTVHGGPCARAAAHLGPRKQTSGTDTLPSAIVFDIAFTSEASRLQPDCVAPLTAELRELRETGVKIYAAQDLEEANGGGTITGKLEIDPNFEANQDSRIYSELTRAGHTLIASVPDVPGGALFSYPKVLRIPPPSPGGQGVGSCALPIVATGRADDVCLPIMARDDVRDSDTEIVTVGTTQAFHARLLRYAAATRDASAFASRVLLIGDEAIDTAPGDPRSKFEVLSWAASQNIAAASGRPIPRVLVDVPLMLGLAAVALVVSAVAFAVALVLLKRNRLRFAIAAIAGIVVPIGILVVVAQILAANSVLFSQLTFPAIVAAITDGVSLWAAIVAYRRDLLVTQLQSRETAVEERYDVFISYARTVENTKWVEENVLAPLSRVRTAEGKPLRIFFDRQSIKIGYTWYTTLVEGVYGSRFFVPIYSEDYFDRPFCRDELDIAMLRQVGAEAFILPIARRVDGIPTRYARVQFVDANKEPDFIESVIAAITAKRVASVAP
jgi:hypothetical protein